MLSEFNDNVSLEKALFNPLENSIGIVLADNYTDPWVTLPKDQIKS